MISSGWGTVRNEVYISPSQLTLPSLHSGTMLSSTQLCWYSAQLPEVQWGQWEVGPQYIGCVLWRLLSL